MGRKVKARTRARANGMTVQKERGKVKEEITDGTTIRKAKEKVKAKTVAKTTTTGTIPRGRKAKENLTTSPRKAKESKMSITPIGIAMIGRKVRERARMMDGVKVATAVDMIVMSIIHPLV